MLSYLHFLSPVDNFDGKTEKIRLILSFFCLWAKFLLAWLHLHSTCRKMYFIKEVLFSEIHSKKILSTLIKCYLGGALESTLLLSGRTFWARCSEKHQCFHVFFATLNKQIVMWCQFNVSPARVMTWAENNCEKLENSEFSRFELNCFDFWFYVRILHSTRPR